MVITIIATGSRSAFQGPVCCRSVTFWYGSGIRIRGSVPLSYRSVSRFGYGSGSCSGSGAAFLRPMLLICDILVQIRILRTVPSVPLSYGSVSRSGYGPASCFFLFWRAGCSLLRAEGFSCSLDVLYGDLGIRIQIQIGILPKMLDLNPDSMNQDPKHWFFSVQR